MKKIRIILTILIVAILSYYLTNYIIKALSYPIKYKEIVILESNNCEVDPYLVFAVIKKESKFNENAVSSKGAKGLMQIMDSTANSLVSDKEYDIFDPKTNISIGTRYLKQLIDRYSGDITMALAAYNAGLGNVDKWKKDDTVFQNGSIVIDNIPFEETKNYTTAVIKYYNAYKKNYDK